MAESKIALCEPIQNRSSILRKPAIYKITNPLGEIYIGGSSNVFNRYGQYSSNSFNGQRKLLNSFLQYGKSSHIFEVIEYCEKEELHRKERYWSLHYDVIEKGLNLDITGDEEHKLTRSSEVKKKIGDSHRGKPIHPNTIKAIIASVKGKKQSKEHIEKRKMFGEKNPMYGKTGFWKGKSMLPHVKLALSKVDRSLGKNGRAKKVIDITNGKIYDSAKELLPIVGMKYSAFRAQLQGRNKNVTNFRYL